MTAKAILVLTILSLVSISFLIQIHPKAFAQNTYQSDKYRIIIGQNDSIPIDELTTTPTPTIVIKPTLKALSPETFEIVNKGFIVKRGTGQPSKGDPFSFKLTPSFIDFDTVLPANPIIKTGQMSISAGDSFGFTLESQLLDSIKSQSGASIPDTSCDEPSIACTFSHAALWQRSDRYGFGYHISGEAVPADFNPENYFRPFASVSNTSSPIVIQSSVVPKSPLDTTIIYKLNVGLDQPAGAYHGIVVFTALPRY